jgi:hypothetical protein
MMDAVSSLIEHKRASSKNLLLGLTIGGYATLSLAIFCFGGALLSSSSRIPAGKTQAFLFMIPGFCVGLLDFVQINAEHYFKYNPHNRITFVALWLNLVPVLGLFAMLTSKALLDGAGFSYFVFLSLAVVTAVSFLLGMLVSLANILWILFAAKARIVLAATVALCLLPALWPAYRMGLFTRDTGRFATRQNQRVYLHPSDVNFQIPQDWLYWNTQFHNNLQLTHCELRKVRFGAGEWDSEYGEVVNSALPFEYCAAHVGGEGWGREGVSFGDLQMRAYVMDLDSQEIFKRIAGPALATAKKLASGGFGAPGQVQSTSGEGGPWQWAVIRYSLFYGDYGGTANVEFFVRPVSRYQLVVVFMGSNEKEKQEILKSFTLPGSF